MVLNGFGVAQPTAPVVRITSLGIDDQQIQYPTANNAQPIELKPGQTINITTRVNEYPTPDKVLLQYRLLGLSEVWQFAESPNLSIVFTGLGTGKYIFQITSILQGQNSSSAMVSVSFKVNPRWYQTLFFKILCAILSLAVLAEIFIVTINRSRRKMRNEFAMQQQINTLQANALRAQMNPHFIFNCLNSIKLLVQNHQNDEATDYLVKFTRLIRSLLETADQPYVSLQAELETCRLYMEMEKLRFGDKFNYHIMIAPEVDCQSIDIPTLIIQPIVENAIWHGIMPKSDRGNIYIHVSENEHEIICTITDDGIGRAASKRINLHRSTHQSKGVSLTSRRLDLFNKLYQSEALLQVDDLLDSDDKPSGTRTTIQFSKYH